MAYPILYKANETNFEHLGVSVLSDASKCHVSREKNGIYILEFDYPVNGKDVEKIKEGMYIKSDAGYRTKNQRFVVSKITKTQNEFKIYCQHISQVKTTMNAIRPDITITGSALMALSTWRDNLLDSRDEFFVQSDITTVNSTTWKVETIENARDALGGKAGSILDVWGGEYEFDNLNITLHKSMGIDNPTIIAYGKNLLDLEQEQSILETYTSVFPFKKYTDENNREQLITLPEILLDSTYLNKFTHRRILKVDFSSDENIKTVEQLRSKAKSYIKSNNVGVPKTNLKINYQDLSKVEGVFDNPALEQIDLCDRLKVYYSELGIMNESAKVVKVIWDVILEENHEIEVGDGRSSFTDGTSAKLETLQAQNDSVLARINALISEQEAAYDRFFKEKSKVIEGKVKDGYEKALLSSEEKIRKMGEAFDEKLAPIRNQVSTAVENYNRQFQATNLEISKNRVEATKQIQVLSDRVSSMQDISSNSTVVELKKLVNEAKETGKSINQKVTELEGNVTREFTSVKTKNENDLNVVKAEFSKGIDGLTRKISSLEEYKNQDSTRTESLKQWVQRDTASQLSRERTEITRIVDAKGYVKNTEFSNKFNENAQGINRKLEALETYKSQDGIRTANLQIWTQNNTANQLTAARRSSERWVDDKGYATTSVVENKVQETANSISREIRNIREIIPTSVGGRNYIPNSGEPLRKEGHSWGGDWEVRTHPYYYNSNKKIMCLPNSTTRENFIRSPRFKLKRNTDYVISFKGFASGNVSSMDLHVLGRRNNETSDFTIFTRPAPIINSRKLSPNGLEVVKNIRFNSGEMDEAYLRFDNNGSTNNQQAILFITEVKLEEGVISTDWTPAPEDSQQSINELNTWKQTATQTLNTVSSTLNDTVKHSQLRIGADGIDFGSNKVFNGRNLASILSVSPESIKAITDRVIITPSNENLVKNEFRGNVTFNKRDLYLNKISDLNKAGDEYYFSVEARQVSGSNGYKDLNAMVHVKYKDGTDDWLSNVLYPASGYGVRNCTATIKIPDRNKEIDFIEPMLQQNTWSNYTTYSINKLTVAKKKSAELIVDGSIEGRQIKTNTLETGHHKAGSITSEIIAANAVRAKHILIDDGLINNLVTHNAFINKLWAQQAFINKLNAVKIRSTQIDTDTLNGVVISGQSKIKIGQYGFLQPIEKGLQINAPENFGSRRGIGLQIAGEGVGPKESGVPPGLFIYEDPDFTRGNTVPSAVNRVLLTVAGMACFSSRILGSVVKGQPILTNLDFSSPFSNHAPVKFIGYKEGGLMRFFSTDNSNSDIWNIKVDQWGSDRKLKTDIKDSEFNAIEFVEKLKFKEHGWNKDEVGYERPYTKCGLIAQELQELDESLVVDYETYLGLDALRLINIALKAVQELSEQNKELKNKLEEIING